MRLLRLRASKLFSIGDEPVEISLDNLGLVLITGRSVDEGSSNGSGKSTVANKAIIWTLFGQTAGGIRGDSVINRHLGGSGTFGEVILEGDKGDRYRIVRKRKPSSLSLEKYSFFDTSFTDITLRSQTETQKLINEIIGRDINSFIQTDFFGQGRSQSFLALSPAQQIELVEQILPISNINEWIEYAKEEKLKLKEKLTGYTSILAADKGRLEELTSMLTSVGYQSDNFNRNKAEELEQLKQELEKFKESEEIDNQIENLSAQVSAITPVDNSTEIQHLETELTQAVQSKQQCYKAITDLGVQRQYLLGEIVNVQNTCPTCKQELTEKAKNILLINQHETRGSIAEVDQYLNVATLQYEAWVKCCEDLEKSLKIERSNYSQSVSEIVKKSEILEKIQALKASSDSKLLQVVLSKIKSCEGRTNPYLDQIVELDSKIDTLTRKNVQTSRDIKKVQRDVDHLEFWIKSFKEFKTYMFDQACPFLQFRTEHHLTGLGNSQIKVQFSTLKELKSGDVRLGFNVNITSDTGGTGFESLSGGEQQLVSFAVGLALADLAETQIKGTSNFLILDEPFMALDDRNCENLINYLANELVHKRETILLISNEENIKALVPSRICLEKINGITRIL
ncbi:MAG: AAA family ATPase [Halobacteriota archaeon]|nr:AAA family ATPase [Halobacteriota archaeon]